MQTQVITTLSSYLSLWWFFIPSLYHVGLPQERTLLCLAVTCFVFFASAAHLATGFRSVVFPLPCHLPRMGISFIFLFFSWLPFIFLRDTYGCLEGDKTCS